MRSDLGKWALTELSYDSRKITYSETILDLNKKGHQIVVNICNSVYKERGERQIVLDVGCGWCDFYDKLKDITEEYIGIEPSLIELSRAIGPKNKHLIRGVGERIILRDNSVDIVLMVSILDHCFEPEKVLDQAFRVLRPGGILVILLENKDKLSNRIRRIFKSPVSHGDHLGYFSLEDVHRLIAQRGEVTFEISYGYLLLFSYIYIDEVLPNLMIKSLSPIADRVGALIWPKNGQHFLLVGKKRNEEGRASDKRPRHFADLLVCAECHSCLTLLENRLLCEECGTTYPIVCDSIIDTLSQLPTTEL